MIRFRHLKTFLALALITLSLGIICSKAYAGLEQGDDNIGTSPCGSNAEICYTGYVSSGGGAVWVYVPLPSSRKIDFKDIKSTYGVYSSSVADCTSVPEAKGVYYLARLWHYSGESRLYGYVYGPMKMNEMSTLSSNYRTANLSWDDGSYTVNSNLVSQKYAYYLSTATGESNNWGGNLSWFCGDDPTPPPSVTYTGKSTVTYNGSSKNTSWSTNDSTTKTVSTKFSPGSSVAVTFKNELKADKTDSGTSSWSVSTTSSVSSVSVTKISSGSSGGNSGTVSTSDTNSHTTNTHKYNVSFPAVYTNDAVDYYVTVCQQINFDTQSGSGAKDGHTKSCVKLHVHKDAKTNDCPLSYYTPPAAGSLSAGKTMSESGVRKGTSAWSHSEYAKPTDTIQFVHCYDPEAQTVKYSNTSHSHGNASYSESRSTFLSSSNSFKINTSNTGGSTVQTKYNNAIKTYYFALTSSSASKYSPATTSGSSVTFTGTLGSTAQAVAYSPGTADSNQYNIEVLSAGGTITQKVTDKSTGDYSSPSDSDTFSCQPYSCSCGESCTTTCYRTCTHSYYKGVTSNTADTSASVYVPYNFTTGISTDLSQSSTTTNQKQIVLAGETASVTAKFDINTRSNTTTNGTYATETPSDTKTEVVKFYIADGTAAPAGSDSVSIPSGNLCSYYGTGIFGCTSIHSKTGSLNNNSATTFNGSSRWASGSNTHSESSTSFSTTVHNVPTGYKFCVAAGISHTDSKNDTNDNGAGSVNNNWRVSAATCRTVIKKPNLQVWGGSFASSGPVTTSIAQKDYINKTFGSWDEFAVVAAGSTTIKNMASGAALGYTSSYASNSTAGGSATKLFCNRAPLSIANNNCVPGTGSNTGSVAGSGITLSTTLYDRIKSRFTATTVTPTYTSGNVDLNSQYAIGPGFRITKATGDIHITAAPSLIGGITHVIYSDGDIYIDTDLKLNTTNEGAKYHDTSELPQYLIISNKNIKIDPSVSQVDAWLVTKTGEVDTCSGHTLGTDLDTTDTNCGKRLVINGPVIAKKLVANRTYGAGAGDSGFTDTTSVQSAETFNLPLTSYLWAYAWANRNPQAYTVYTRSLAPRL